MDIVDFNPWWETGGVDRFFSGLKRRYLFNVLKRYLDKRHIDVVIGLRRVGKTVLMYHLIDELLRRDVDPRNILYFSFDVEKRDLNRIIREYEERILHDKIRDSRVYIFLDEVHKLDDWMDKIKILYDLNPKIKLVLSGSASLNIMRGGRESLAGRALFHILPPLTFIEFLDFMGEAVPPKEDFEIYRSRLNILLNRFMLRGFPETLNMSDREAERYVRELVVERIIYRDIPESFGVGDLEIVRVLAEYIFRNPGITLNIDSLSRSLGRHKKTIRNALNYLELSFLIKRLSNVRGSFLASSRKYRRAYPLHPSLSLSRDEGLLAEILVRSELDAEYYWRTRSYEVDFILKNHRVIPVEAKYKNRIDKRDLRGLVKFSSLYNVKEGYLVSKDLDDTVLIDNISIRVSPLVKFILWDKPVQRPLSTG